MSDQKKIELPPQYTPPTLTVIGSVYDVTLAQQKLSGPSDGMFWGAGLTNSSP